MRSSNCLTLPALTGLMFGLATQPQAGFVSGSTGADGALDVTTTMSLQVQEDGVHNYTTINVANGAILTLLPNSRNTPAIFLATDDVTIFGTINIAGANGRYYGDPLGSAPGQEAQPGPGGYPGGLGGLSVTSGGDGRGTAGGGPGGGQASATTASSNGRGRPGNAGSHATPGGVNAESSNQTPPPTYGDPRLLTLTGGSGGAGGNAITTSPISYTGSQGGAGGGALLIASSKSIQINGTINANGGIGGNGAVNFNGGGTEGAGAGAGGEIRLMANDSITGIGSLSARGGASGSAAGGDGRIRLESFSISGLTNVDPPAVRTTPTVVSLNPSEIPTVRIATIGGQTVPDPPSGSTSAPDVTIPAATPNPVTIGIVTTHVPTGSTIRLRLTLENGDILTANSTPVDGSGNASASVTLPTGYGIVYATADFP
jgi:hypothetical protein